MTIATSIRTTVRSKINELGSTISIYSFTDATVTYNEEGDESITWGSATSEVGVSSRNVQFTKMMANMGIENNPSDNRVIILKDTATVAKKDKVVIGSDSYEVVEVKNLDPIQNTLIAIRIEIRLKQDY